MDNLKPEKWTVGGPIDRWRGDFPNDKIRTIFYQLSQLPSDSKIATLSVLEKLREICPNQPFVLARLAELYWLLQHIHGAKVLVFNVLKIIGKMDPVFINWAQHVIDQGNRDEIFQRHLYHNFPKTRYVFYAKKLSSIEFYNIKEPFSQKIHQIWNTEQEISNLYYRLACIENNELEGVFCLQNKSIQKLVYHGFFEDMMDLDSKSKNKSKPNIVAILKDTQKALNKVMEWQNNIDFSELFVMELHKMLVESDRIGVKVDEITKKSYCVLIPVEEWRHKTVYALQAGNIPSYIVFHPFYKVAESMEIFAIMVQKLFNFIKIRVNYCHQNPYSIAAWIHHALITIHPFEDGNGRVARFIASLPLVMAGLPPICISSKNKCKYLQVLKEADMNMDIGPLAEFIASETMECFEQIKSFKNLNFS